MTDAAKAIQATRRAQASAADPIASVWVAANAGTGKTHVLTTRILRLLLQGTSPERILALTYTKAAAAEMARRTFDTLSRWVTSSDEELAKALRELLDRAPTVDEARRARELFARAIETPGGLKVQTIHAFCERLLKRFPLEAGVSPHFSILDDALAAEMRREAVDATLTRAARDEQSQLGQALKTAIVYAVDDQFDAVLADALRARDWLDTVARLGLMEPGTRNDAFAAADAAYRKTLGLKADDSLASVHADMARVVDDATMQRASAVLAEGGKTDQQLGDALTRARKASSVAERVAALENAFLTAEGEPRSDTRFITKKIREKEPGLTAELVMARDRLAKLGARQTALRLHEATMALVTLASAVAETFHSAKLARAALDFDDLIEKVGRLIGRPGTDTHASAAEWVLYKLDGGIDHILVDEAQDTSRPQWAVVEGLAQAFYESGGARADDVRTLFAVGDEKQSIYGFQGAAPKMFAEMAQLFERQAGSVERPFRRVPLTLSFRTVSPVLQLVDRVFAEPDRTPGLTAAGSAIRHDAYRAGQAGLVELWPLEPYTAAEES
ncbi:MAG: hypothetical protein RL291_1330, partial [Pseudomonadota bacterium]